MKVLEAEAQCRWEANFELENAWTIRQYICEFEPDNLNNLLSIILLSIELEEFSPQGQLTLLQASNLLLKSQIDPAQLNLDLILKVLEKLSEVNPYDTFFEVCLNWTNLLKETQRIGEIKKKLALNYQSLGIFLYNQRSYSQAFNQFKKALELQPELEKTELAALKFNIGISLASQGRFEPALGFFQEALEANPDFNQALYQINRVRYEAENFSTGYQFTQDWFSMNIPVWEEHLARFAHQPNLNFLEIGSWEGRSTCWLLKNILTDQSAKIDCIDTFEGSLEHHQWYDESYIKSVEERFNFNIAKTGGAEKVKKIVGRSQEMMRTLSFNFYDLLYIDGSHLASDVLLDTALGWELVKVGGVIIFDDYDFTFPGNPQQNTKIAIDAFLTVFCQKIKVIYVGHQVLIEKTAD
ncbi:MAG: class I SAM-dependent methyltransferase [Microcoleus vaginatus WJT46-NPBG5]|nr:class I SAM-dependent methyltransferase [Microcoleus vaginatus WJT46-NPBG5]